MQLPSPQGQRSPLSSRLLGRLRTRKITRGAEEGVTLLPSLTLEGLLRPEPEAEAGKGTSQELVPNQNDVAPDAKAPRTQRIQQVNERLYTNPNEDFHENLQFPRGFRPAVQNLPSTQSSQSQSPRASRSPGASRSPEGRTSHRSTTSGDPAERLVTRLRRLRSKEVTAFTRCSNDDSTITLSPRLPSKDAAVARCSNDDPIISEGRGSAESEDQAEELVTRLRPLRRKTAAVVSQCCSDDSTTSDGRQEERGSVESGDNTEEIVTRLRRFSSIVSAGSERRWSNGRAGEGGVSLTHMWANTIHETMCKAKLDHCRLSRIWVFGHVNGATLLSPPEVMEQALQSAVMEKVGNTESLRQLYDRWVLLDNDLSGTVDLEEFQEYSKKMLRKSRGQALIPQDLNNLQKALFGYKTGFTLERMMKLIWPAAQSENISRMKSWIGGLHWVCTEDRVPEPATLPTTDLEGLMTVYRDHDTSGNGRLAIQQLVLAGVVQPYQLSEFRRLYDLENSGIIDPETFCKLMCPAGYRITSYQKEGISQSGQRVSYSEKDGCWYIIQD